MKKFKKLGKVWNVVAIIMTFVVTFSVVYATGTYFYQRYGTPGALSDKVLTNTEWDALMEELDTFSCPSTQCPECNCNGTKMYASPSGNILRKWRSPMENSASLDTYDWQLYEFDGSPASCGGISVQDWQCGGSFLNSTASIYLSSNGTKFCTYTSCPAGTYFMHGRWNWVRVTIAHPGGGSSSSSATLTTAGILGGLNGGSISGITIGDSTKVTIEN